IVNSKLDVVLFHEPLDAWEYGRLAGANYQRHPSELRIIEILPYAVIGIRLEGDQAAADDLEACRLHFVPRRGNLCRRRVVGEMYRFQIDEPRAERLRHLNGLGARKFSQRVAGNAELEPVIS